MSEHIESKVIAFRKEVEKRKNRNPNPNTLYEKLGTDSMWLMLGSDFVPLADPDLEGKLLPKIHKMRIALVERTGFIMGNIRVMDSSKIAANEYVIAIRGITLAKGCFDLYKEGASSSLDPNWTIMTDTSTKLSFQTIDQIERLDQFKCEKAMSAMMAHIDQCIVQHIDKLLNRLGTQKLMELIRQHDQSLIKEIAEKLSISDIQLVLVNLIQEEVSIKDIMHIFESICGSALNGLKTEEIVERVRKDFSFAICDTFSDEENNLPAIVIQDTHHLLDSGEEYLKLLGKIHEHLEKNVFHKNRPCIICPPETRRKSFEKLRRQIPNIIVLSREEITSDIKVITLEGI